MSPFRAKMPCLVMAVMMSGCGTLTRQSERAAAVPFTYPGVVYVPGRWTQSDASPLLSYSSLSYSRTTGVAYVPVRGLAPAAEPRGQAEFKIADVSADMDADATPSATRVQVVANHTSQETRSTPAAPELLAAPLPAHSDVVLLPISPMCTDGLSRAAIRSASSGDDDSTESGETLPAVVVTNDAGYHITATAQFVFTPPPPAPPVEELSETESAPSTSTPSLPALNDKSEPPTITLPEPQPALLQDDVTPPANVQPAKPVPVDLFEELVPPPLPEEDSVSSSSVEDLVPPAPAAPLVPPLPVEIVDAPPEVEKSSEILVETPLHIDPTPAAMVAAPVEFDFTEDESQDVVMDQATDAAAEPDVDSDDTFLVDRMPAIPVDTTPAAPLTMQTQTPVTASFTTAIVAAATAPATLPATASSACHCENCRCSQGGGCVRQSPQNHNQCCQQARPRRVPLFSSQRLKALFGR